MKFSWRWLRFGGWFSVEPVGEKKKFIMRRAKVHLLRVGADLAKVLLILLTIYFISMPFWPLAVPPVPAELKAKYPIPEFHPRGNGEVERMWHALYPEPAPVFANGKLQFNSPPELTNAPLVRLSEASREMRFKPGSGSPQSAEMRAWLAEIEPQIHAMADLCTKEDPPNRLVDGSPVKFTPMYRLLIDVFKVLPGIHSHDGDVEAALRAIQSLARISAYHTKGDCLIGWLVGNMLSEMAARAVADMYAYDLIDPPVALEIENILKEWQENRGTVVRVIRHETLGKNRFQDLVWGKQQPRSVSEKHWFAEDEAKQIVRRLRYGGWVVGNSYRALKTTGRNLSERLEIEAVIWSDPTISDPGDVASDLWEYTWSAPGWPRLRRGALAAVLTPQISRYYRKYFSTDATHRIGHALAAIGAYKNIHNALPASLDEAFAAAGIGNDFQTAYVDQVPSYQRLDGGEPTETNAYAFTLTIWGDGGRCDKAGGVSWLIVRNPSFGDAPVRCWNWMVLESRERSGAGVQKANRRQATLEPGPVLIPEDGAKQAVLGVPVTLLSPDASVLEEAKQLLQRSGWQEVAIPPRIMSRN